MSQIDQVQSALLEFLESKNAGVLAIKGEWGVGKTYFWKRFIGQNKGHLEQSAYSYVSLFGLESIGKLQRSIFAKQETLGSRTKSSWTWLKNHWSKIFNHLDFGRVTLGTLKNTEIWSEIIQDSLLKNFLVCIDDLERKEDSITPSALLGFISNLRDERGCKVILLYNEVKINAVPKLRAAMAEYREKVIDIEIAFEPTVDECYAIIFGPELGPNELPESEDASATPFLGADSRSALQLFRALKVSNIRVMRKTRDALSYFETHVKTKYPKLWPHFARQLVKLSSLHYVYGETLPLETLLKSSSLTDRDLEKSDDPEKRSQFAQRKPIRDISYYPSETDAVIADFLIRGFVDWGAREPMMRAAERDFQLSDVKTNHRVLWSKLWKNFQTSQSEFITEQLAFLEAHWPEMQLADVDGVAKFVKEIEPTPRIDEILELRIAQFAAEQKNLNDFYLFHNVSKETALRARQLLDQNIEKKPIREAMQMMTARGGWTPEDIKYLLKTSETEFYDWLVKEDWDEVLYSVKEFRDRFGGNPEGTAVVGRLDAALHVIAKRSKMDEARVYSNIGVPRPVN